MIDRLQNSAFYSQKMKIQISENLITFEYVQYGSILTEGEVFRTPLASLANVVIVLIQKIKIESRFDCVNNEPCIN